MGRHYRDEEPVPHPQDRTPRVPAEGRPSPAEGRSEASGAFRTPGRSSISDAFGIAGRAAGASRESSASAFFTEGAEAPGFPPGFPPEHSGAQPAVRRGEASGSYPVAERATDARPIPASGPYPAASRIEVPGAYAAAGSAEAPGRARRKGGKSAGPRPAPNRTEAPGFHPAEPTRGSRRGEAPGSSAEPARGSRPGEAPGSDAGRSETTAAYPVEPAGRSRRKGGKTTTGAHPAADRLEVPGTQPAAGHAEPARASRRGEAPGTHPAGDRIEAPGTQPAFGHPAPGHAEPTRRGEAPGSYADPAEATAAYPVEPAGRSRRKGGRNTGTHPARRGEAPAVRHPESAAERTEVITRPDDLADAPDEASGTFRTLDRSDDTGTSRAAGRGESTERVENTGPHRTARDENTGPQRAARSDATGSHRVVGKGDVTGSHRIVGKKAPRRRIATWPIACLVLAVLIGLGVVGWNWADNELNSRAEAQAASCDGGTSNMRIIVTPSAQKPLTAAAERWNQAATVVHGQCVHVAIEAKASAQVLDALVGRTNLDSIGGLPAAWLPESSYWVSELTTKKPEMIGSPAQSVANARSADYPFIGLAGPNIDDTVLRAAQTFREYLEQPAQQADFTAAGIKPA
ncbi:hypothetical protein AB0F15_07635 [Amycolatopsis sp. NPDC026612]|uniref:hypothetical protein n=1 Tax=Amycolatopsis sp. NPDC026612 TaxID=3155466 RepID=UPI0033F25D0C